MYDACIVVAHASDEWHVAQAADLGEEYKVIEAGFEFIRYSEKGQVAIYRKRK